MTIHQVWDKPLCGSIWVRVIKTTGNIGKYRPRVSRMKSEPNQSYYPVFD